MENLQFFPSAVNIVGSGLAAGLLPQFAEGRTASLCGRQSHRDCCTAKGDAGALSGRENISYTENSFDSFFVFNSCKKPVRL